MGLLLILVGCALLAFCFVPKVRLFFDIYVLMFALGCGIAAIFIGLYHLAAQ